MHNWCQAPAGAFAGCFLLRTDKSRKESYGGVDDGLWNWENPANCTDFSQAFSSHVEWSKTWCKTRWTLRNCCAWFSPVSFRVMIIRLRCELHKMSGALAAFCFGACGCLPLVASVASTAEWSAPRGMGRTGIHRSTRGRRFREGQGRERYTRSIWQPPGSRDFTPLWHSKSLYATLLRSLSTQDLDCLSWSISPLKHRLETALLWSFWKDLWVALFSYPSFISFWIWRCVRVTWILCAQDVVIHSCSFDPGLVQVPLEGNEIVLVRVAASEKTWLRTV